MPSISDRAQTPPYDLPGNDIPLESAVEQKLQLSLSDQERIGGLIGWVARKLLSAGDWIEREVEERRQTIGGIDNMWLLLTDATEFNPVCACTYTLRGKISLQTLQNATRRLEKKFPRYRQRLTSVGRKFHGARFEDDPNYNVQNHVHLTTLPEPAGKRELDDLMGKFIAQDWDLEKPLWEMILVENYHDEDGAECAIITRGHHTLADGQGFVISQLYMTSYHQDLVKMMTASAHHVKAAKQGRLQPSKVHPWLRPLDRFTDPSHVMISPLIQLFLLSLFWSVYAFSVGFSFFLSTYQAVVQAALFLVTCWRVDMLTTPQPGPRVLDREFSSSKTVRIDDIKLCQRAFSGTYPGSAVKEMKAGGRSKVGHVTLNDLICSIMADVLGEERRYMPRDESTWGRIKVALKRYLPSPIGFFIPISVRTPGDWSMRNLSTGSIVYLDPSPPLNISPSSLHAHIHRCRSALSLLKHSIWPRVLFHLTQFTGHAPFFWPIPFAMVKVSGNVVREWVFLPLVRFALQSFPVILTNVPGPAQRPIELEGVEVIDWTALPPQGGKGTLGMGIISYAGGLCISVAADRVEGSEGVARRICERFEERFAVYVECAKDILDHQD